MVKQNDRGTRPHFLGWEGVRSSKRMKTLHLMALGWKCEESSRTIRTLYLIFLAGKVWDQAECHLLQGTSHGSVSPPLLRNVA